MVTNDGSYLTFAFDGKDQRKMQTQTLSVNKAYAQGLERQRCAERPPIPHPGELSDPRRH